MDKVKIDMISEHADSVYKNIKKPVTPKLYYDDIKYLVGIIDILIAENNLMRLQYSELFKRIND